jgi:hypothetical protein
MIERPIFKGPAYPCPYCGKINNASINFGGRPPPVPGDVTVCEGCSEVRIFGDDLVGRKPTARELFELIRSPGWPEVLEAQRVVLMARRRPHGVGWEAS